MNRAVREALLLGLLAVLPLIAFSPALRDGRLLGPGDGAAFHYPLKRLAWESWPEPPSWNPTIFGGTPLLADYRVGAFYPPTFLAGLLDPFFAFQSLVLFSISASSLLSYGYLRTLGAERVGAFVGAMAFGLGPYLIDHLADTATLTAAPTLPILLWAGEVHLRRSSRGSASALALAVALLLLSGSPEAVGAGAILLSLRLVLGHVFPASRQRPRLHLTVLALVCGIFLAAPQLLPSFIALREAGRGALGMAGSRADALPGLTGRILRYVSHTPAPSLALAALPLVLDSVPVRSFILSLALVLSLQWGRGPLAAPGALSMAFDFCLAILAGLAISAQWRNRRERAGRRIRAYFLFAAVASALALSISAATLGPLPQNLSSAVGILAFSLILYFSLLSSPEPFRAGLFLIPLTTSFLMQPAARGVWESAPSRQELEEGTATTQAISRAMSTRSERPTLALARSWPRLEAQDLAFANLASLLGRRSLNGYDPMVPKRTRRGLGDMTSAGLLPGAFFRGDPTRLELLGALWVEAPTSALTCRPDPHGLGDTLDLRLELGRPHFFPLPITPATEVRIASHLSGAVQVPQGEAVARLRVHLASGRALELFLRAGRDTAEWAYDRPDVRPFVRHEKPEVLEALRDPRGGFEGHQYLGVLTFPGRYVVEGLEVERLPGMGELLLSRIGLSDRRTGGGAPISLLGGFVSDEAHFHEALTLPAVRLFELPNSLGPARVVERLRLLPNDEAVLAALDSPETLGFDPRREALATGQDGAGWVLPQGSTSSGAKIELARGGHIVVRAEGPGLLVLAQSWDAGWSATVDSKDSKILRVNQVQMGVVLPPGFPRVEFHHHAPGLGAGLALAACPPLLLAVVRLRSFLSAGRLIGSKKVTES